MTVWGRATSSNVQKVMWAVGELGLPHRRHDVGGVHGGLDAPDFAARTPHRLVPVVEWPDGTVMWESNAIVRRLALLDPDRRLWPADAAAGAAADMWAEWAHHALQRPLIALFWAFVRTRPAERDAALIAALHRETVAALRAAEPILAARPFLAGDRFTIADINFGHLLFRYHTMAIERPPLPALAQYYEGLTRRPAYRAHVMVDYSSLVPTP
nr:glutathione S-transferase family protein [Acuticoccus mangrovi]